MMLDPHSPQLEGFFDHPVDCLKVTVLSFLQQLTLICCLLKVEPLFCTWIKNHIPNWEEVAPQNHIPIKSRIMTSFSNWEENIRTLNFVIAFARIIFPEQCIVVSPDEGGAKRSEIINSIINTTLIINITIICIIIINITLTTITIVNIFNIIIDVLILLLRSVMIANSLGLEFAMIHNR